MSEGYQTTVGEAEKEGTKRKGSAFNRRKSSAVPEVPEAIVEAHELSVADRRLAELGYVQVYKREFSWLSCVSFAFSISGLFATVSTTFIYPLEAGGAASTVWCWLISGGGCYCIALSVAELVSAYPTCGGLYFTCKYLAPEAWVPEIGWLTGWLNLLGQIAGAASTEYGCAQLLLAAVSMSTNFSYLPTAGHTVGVMAASTLLHSILNSLKTSYLEKMTKTYVIFHIAVLAACCITLLVMCDNKHDSHYVWTDVTNSSGWTPNGWSFMFGFLGASWVMTDYDATAHIAEEIKNPEIKAPWSIAAALGFTWIGGWLFTIVLAYTMGDPTEILESPIAQPVAQIFYNVTGRSGGIFFTVAAYIVLNFTAMTAIQAGSRTIWAFARDELLPGSRIWYKINKSTDTPIYATWLFTVCCVLINLIGLGSYTAITAIFNLTAIALDWSYCIPVICKLLYGKFEPGPFHLGKASVPINVTAVVWTTFVTIIYVMPTIRPVTAENMNYVIVLMAAVGLFAVIYWYAAGRYYYTGPRVKTQLIVGVEGETSSNESKLGPDDNPPREIHFDDVIGSGVTPELDPVPTPYKNLAWPGFNVYNTTQAVTLLKATSPPNVAASVTLFQALQGNPSTITTAGTNTKSFNLKSLTNACVVASQTGLVAQSCTIQYNGTKAVGGGTVSTLCSFTADLLKPKAALCTLPSSFSGLTSVTVVPVTATLPPKTTVVFLDDVSGSVTL